MEEKDKEVLFEISDHSLYVANGGAQFSRKGVIGVCASHLSEKGEITSDIFECTDESLVEEIRKCELETYDLNRNRITRDSQAEKETTSDYAGRFIWELLQNADDAMRSQSSEHGLIGSKGLGFKSVLEVCDELEVHSVPFHFKFSSEQTHSLLVSEQLHENPPPLTFSIPHDCKPDSKTANLLEAGYSTVIRLPFKHEIAEQTVSKRLKELDSPLFLLLVREISNVRIRTAKGESIYWIDRLGGGQQANKVRLHCKESGYDGVTEHSQAWQRWAKAFESCRGTHLEVAICLPMSEHGVPEPFVNKIPFHVFFQTDEPIGARALIHAPFELQQNRKHTREGENDEAILEAFGELLSEVVDEIPPETTIQVFKEVPCLEEHSPSAKLTVTIWKTLLNHAWVPVLGGSRVMPYEVKLWEDGLGEVLREDADDVKGAHLLIPRLQVWASSLQDDFDADFLPENEYFEMLCFCKNDSLEACLRSYRVLIERLRCHGETSGFEDVPCWWTADESARPLWGTNAFLFKEQQEWPEWLTIDILHPQFAETWSEDKENLENRTAQLVAYYFLQRNEDFLNRALVPTVRKWDETTWEKLGWDALRAAHSWWKAEDFAKISPFVPFQGVIWLGRREEEDSRTKCSEAFRVPTNRGWMPAADCYAGMDWEGFQSFDEYFVDVEDRGVVLPLSQWTESLQEFQIERWKPLLRYIGVSWEPKLRSFKPHLTHAMYPEYVKSLPKRGFSNLKGRVPGYEWSFNLLLEHFPGSLAHINVEASTKLSIREMLPLLRAVQKNLASHTPSSRPYPCKSFAFHQLSHEAWLPCQPALLHPQSFIAPNRVFGISLSIGLGKLLPLVDKTGIDEREWYQDMRDTLIGFGVREELPDKASDWHEWMRALSEMAPNVIQEEPDKFRAAARALFKGYLNSEIDDFEFPSDISIPSEQWTAEGKKMVFSPPDEVYFVDEPHLDEVLDEVLRRGQVKTFLLKLKSAEKAPESLQLKPLSSCLRSEPYFEATSDVQDRKRILGRYFERREGLRLAAGLANPLPEDINVNPVKDLHLRLYKRSEHIADVPVLSWQSEDGTLLVNLDKNRWRSLAHGLSVRVLKKVDLMDLFENLLRENSLQEFRERLRDSGVSEEELSNADFDWYTPEKSAEMKEDRGWRVTSPVESQESSEGELASSTNPESGHEPISQLTLPRQKRNLPGQHSSPDPDAGREAENWLWHQLQEAFPGQIARNERDPQGRESDFVVRFPDNREIHIEVKHAQNAPFTIFWSGLECDKACIVDRDPRCSYYMALLTPDEEDEYEIRWIWKPLEDLKQAKRDVQWSGTTDYRRFDSDSWDVSKHEDLEIASLRHKFRIQLSIVMAEQLDRDTGALQALISRIS